MKKAKKADISPLQRWARRRNYEKRQMEWVHRELIFRRDARWMEGKNRSQTQTDCEIETITKTITLFKQILENWDRNSEIIKQEVDFKEYK
tara:strand:- start:5963 stop:6235 length:273 start_codon:yes stop_codon:yes gene_type:complete